jgi:chemotaxis protein methyltransferase CheR
VGDDCTAFLQWALPRLDLRWPGFRKVRGQVCKRVKRRIRELGLDGFAAYRARLEAEPAEWQVLDDCCHITISRFFRDRGVFEVLRRRVLPEIAARTSKEGREARCWSAGCASGEEPYTVRIIWDIEVARAFPGAALAITATDIDRAILERAREGCFGAASLRELPPQLFVEAFDRVDDRYCVRPKHRERLDFLLQDIRSEVPPGRFDLVLCRNLVFTYFAPALQRRLLARLLQSMAPTGYLVIGTHERLPDEAAGLRPLEGAPQVLAVSAALDPP